MPLFIGIDGGGTKTACAVGDDVSMLAMATGPGSNVVRLGEAQARAGLQSTISEACRVAGVSPLQVSSLCIGAAGAANPEVANFVRGALRQVFPNTEVVVVGDMVIAMEAALHDQPGVVAIAGTGSIAYGRNAIGETARAGGWGYAISDEGSGQWIGRTAVAEVMRAHDSARSTVLLDRILDMWSLGSRDELVRRANSSAGPNFSELFPAVQKAASEHDELAEAILRRAGAELGQLVLTVLHRLWSHGESVRVGVAGGVFANSSEVRRAFYNSVHSDWPTTSVCFKVTDPVIGALWMARRVKTSLGSH